MATNIVEKLRLFLSQQSCLIAETSPALALTVRAKLVELGVPNAQIWTAPKFAIAKQMLVVARPTMFVVDHEMDANCIDELICLHEQMHEPGVRTIFLTSRNAAVGVLMEDRASQIDSFLLKPFSADGFRDRLIAVAKFKVEPPAYVAKLNAGKFLLAKNETDGAMKEFEAAKSLNPKPTMAWFYAGETSRKQGNPDKALECYREGLKTQPSHYRCSLAEFEALTELGRSEDAFALIGSIVESFPVSVNRLIQFFDVTVSAKRFDGLPSLYNVFRQLEHRSTELVEAVETAFLDAGKFLLADGDVEKALTYFDTGVQVASRRFDYVERVVRELVCKEAVSASTAFLGKIAPSDVGTPAFEQLVFCVDRLTMTGDQLLNRGRQIVFAGHGTPEIFHLVVRSFAEAGKETLAESAICKAIETNPELRSSLYKVLADHLPK